MSGCIPGHSSRLQGKNKLSDTIPSTFRCDGLGSLVKLNLTGSDPEWILGAVYASTSGAVRKDLWKLLSSTMGQGLPVCFIGDFNVILTESERKGGAPFRFNWKIKDFASFVSENGLFDIPSEGSPFTWQGGLPGGGRVMKKLDCCLVSVPWLDLYPQATLKHLIFTKASDHCPLLLE